MRRLSRLDHSCRPTVFPRYVGVCAYIRSFDTHANTGPVDWLTLAAQVCTRAHDAHTYQQHISYVELSDMQQVRQRHLSDAYYFTCACDCCRLSTHVSAGWGGFRLDSFVPRAECRNRQLINRIHAVTVGYNAYVSRNGCVRVCTRPICRAPCYPLTSIGQIHVRLTFYLGSIRFYLRYVHDGAWQFARRRRRRRHRIDRFFLRHGCTCRRCTAVAARRQLLHTQACVPYLHAYISFNEFFFFASLLAHVSDDAKSD